MPGICSANAQGCPGLIIFTCLVMNKALQVIDPGPLGIETHESRGISLGSRIVFQAQMQQGPLEQGHQVVVQGVDDQGRVADPDLRSRLTDHLMSARAQSLTIGKYIATIGRR